ncbi:FAD binding domain-containing protein [Eoetvoesiella caeni]|uniref:Carbon-monoxide dehydrogenase small subunit/xanthine dehydrogenase small subunit n=1 Tax=Eoetvoesiella caeni TaxID=645616 RepID=A0A366H0T1_9BURK|nr:FAD binding domain-containing protein [Eoetvoesiella caeni]MCI2810993.1 FAD binding domain-containing protein [Eoetvoesiella caeni]NYT56891.1 FAD binding domain-containing protein [Eoetvoesiella caeni]RBP35459.1 carbon-monoxide dehydrogenase small subunit/xanthine dehydrogenase small subunit [Eoetvoesiella caeni]
MIKLSVNGERRTLEADPRSILLNALREDLGLTGTKYGCGEGECGACTVVVDGSTVCSCLVLAGSVEGCEITTIEGLVEDPLGASLIDSFAHEGAVQCGFCIPGFIVQGWHGIASGEIIDDQSLRHALGGNLCRCTGYTKIVAAMEKSLAQQLVSSRVTGKQGQGVETQKREGYWRPATLKELLEGLASITEAYHFVAGGTDILVQNVDHLKDLQLIDLNAIVELLGITESDGFVRIGSRASWTDLQKSDLVARHAPLLAQAAKEVGAGQIQNRGTLAGNIANASPAADGLPPLYVYDALVVCESAQGVRQIPIAEFVLGPGQTALQPGELITEILVPSFHARQNELYFFEKRGPRKAQTISKASVAFHQWTGSDGVENVRIAIGAVAKTVLRVPEAESLLARGDDPEVAADAVRKAAQPITDIRSTADYREWLVGSLLLRGLADHGVYKAK